MTATSEHVRQACVMAAGGWSYRDIARLLAKDGVNAHPTVIAEWVDDELAERRRERQRQRMRVINARRTQGRLGAGPPRSPEFKLERMRSLRSLGMSHNAIACVMTFDFPDEPLTADQVRGRLRDRTRASAA